MSQPNRGCRDGYAIMGALIPTQKEVNVMTLAVQHLVGGYSQIPVLKDISFQVEPGELVGLIGLNGAGK